MTYLRRPHRLTNLLPEKYLFACRIAVQAFGDEGDGLFNSACFARGARLVGLGLSSDDGRVVAEFLEKLPYVIRKGDACWQLVE